MEPVKGKGDGTETIHVHALYSRRQKKVPIPFAYIGRCVPSVPYYGTVKTIAQTTPTRLHSFSLEETVSSERQHLLSRNARRTPLGCTKRHQGSIDCRLFLSVLEDDASVAIRGPHGTGS